MRSSHRAHWIALILVVLCPHFTPALGDVSSDPVWSSTFRHVGNGGSRTFFHSLSDTSVVLVQGISQDDPYCFCWSALIRVEAYGRDSGLLWQHDVETEYHACNDCPEYDWAGDRPVAVGVTSDEAVLVLGTGDAGPYLAAISADGVDTLFVPETPLAIAALDDGSILVLYHPGGSVRLRRFSTSGVIDWDLLMPEFVPPSGGESFLSRAQLHVDSPRSRVIVVGEAKNDFGPITSCAAAVALDGSVTWTAKSSGLWSRAIVRSSAIDAAGGCAISGYTDAQGLRFLTVVSPQGEVLRHSELGLDDGSLYIPVTCSESGELWYESSRGVITKLQGPTYTDDTSISLLELATGVPKSTGLANIGSPVAVRSDDFIVAGGSDDAGLIAQTKLLSLDGSEVWGSSGIAEDPRPIWNYDYRDVSLVLLRSSDLYVLTRYTVGVVGGPYFRLLVSRYELSGWPFAQEGRYPGESRAVAWTRPDTDDDRSLFITRFGGTNVLLQRDASGEFTESTPEALDWAANGVSTLWFDIGNNGRLDPYVLNIDEPNVLLYNNGAGDYIDITTQILSDTAGSRSAEAMDIDNDGDLDLFLRRAGDLPDLLLEQRESGFVDATPPVLAASASTSGSSAGDYDNDGDLDLYVVRWNSSNLLVRNDGDGTWTDANRPELADAGQGTSAAWGDFDNDGLLDLAFTNWRGPNKIYHNDGEQGFTDVTPAAVEADSSNGNVAWVDYDNDGFVDLFYTRGSGAGTDRLWRNTGFGFEEASTPFLSAPGNHAGAAWADADGDGDIDVFQAEFEEDAPSRMLLNQLDNGNSWIEVDLVGIESNRFGIGARIRVVAGGLSQIRDVVCSAGNKSQNMITAHFGLGSATSIDSMIIRWPSGLEQVGTDLAVNELKTIWEGGSMTAVPSVPTARGQAWLGRAVPNPFNPSTTISYGLPHDGHVELTIYDLAGRRVKVLVSEHVSAGEHEVSWHGRDEAGKPVASGVYLYQLRAGDFGETKRMVLVK